MLTGTAGAANVALSSAASPPPMMSFMMSMAVPCVSLRTKGFDDRDTVVSAIVTPT